MGKRLAIVSLAVGITFILLYLSPAAVAQQNEIQRAHDTGYQNGIKDAHSNKPMNLNTNSWHGDRLTAYQQGYQEGYRRVRGGGENGWRAYQDRDDQRAYQTGYRNGTFDRKANRPMNPNNDDWYGKRLDIYRKAYEQGYRGIRGQDDDQR